MPNNILSKIYIVVIKPTLLTFWNVQYGTKVTLTALFYCGSILNYVFPSAWRVIIMQSGIYCCMYCVLKCEVVFSSHLFMIQWALCYISKLFLWNCIWKLYFLFTFLMNKINQLFKNWMFNFVSLLKYKSQMTGNKLCKPAQRSRACLHIICYPSSDIYTSINWQI